MGNSAYKEIVAAREYLELAVGKLFFAVDSSSNGIDRQIIFDQMASLNQLIKRVISQEKLMAPKMEVKP